jgi:DNA-binding transcriptional LysR family regulator
MRTFVASGTSRSNPTKGHSGCKKLTAECVALQDSELTWEIVYTSPSLTGLRAAALAGLAITPLPESTVIAGLRILGAEAGLPRLPDIELAIYEKPRPDKAAAALAAALLALAQGSSRPTI